MKRIVLLLVFSILLSLSCKKIDPVIGVSGPSELTLASSASVLSLRLDTNCDSWTYDLGGADWISEQKIEGTDLYFSVSENKSTEARKTVITFYAPDKSVSAAVASVSVTQRGAVLEPELNVESSVDIPVDGGQLSISVSTNQSGWDFEQLEGGDWISASKEGNALKIVVSSNPSEDSRTARYRIYAPGVSDYKVFKDIVVLQKERVIEYDPVDLSATGTSNCYVITHKGIHSFNATVRGNGASTSGLSAPAKLEPSGAKLVWQTTKGMIKSVSYSAGVITFDASRIPGSAVIAATDSQGAIIWSWHIWYPAVELESLRTEAGDEMMSINLGALDGTPSSISSHGMLYQWGRKDPFPYSPVANEGSVFTVNIPVYDIDGNQVKIGQTSMYNTKDNNLAFSIAHPEICISNNQLYATNRDWLLAAESNVALWGNPQGSEHTGSKYPRTGSKSYFDPCPIGWRVPPVRDVVYMTESGGYTWATGDTENGLNFMDLGGAAYVAVVDIDGDGKYTLKDYKDGWTFYLDKSADVQSYFPAATRYDGQYAMLMGSMVGLWANYWTNTATPASDGLNGLAIALSYGIMDYNHKYSITISPVSNGSRADAYSVRCIKEQ